ncbi:MAG: metal-dependent hydrolase, partial [Pseudomonadota bacterium]|nr:metal-dependent hydrolase [Pseudomonadota bacterium]
MTGTVLANALLADKRRIDIAIEHGRISAIEPGGTIPTPAIDFAGALLVAGFVDGHIHLDKTLLGLPFVPHRPGSSIAERIARERELRRELAYPVEQRAHHLIARAVAHGTTALR